MSATVVGCWLTDVDVPRLQQTLQVSDHTSSPSSLTFSRLQGEPPVTSRHAIQLYPGWMSLLSWSTTATGWHPRISKRHSSWTIRPVGTTSGVTAQQTKLAYSTATCLMSTLDSLLQGKRCFVAPRLILSMYRCQASCSKNNMPFAGLQAVGSSWVSYLAAFVSFLADLLDLARHAFADKRCGPSHLTSTHTVIANVQVIIAVAP